MIEIKLRDFESMVSHCREEKQFEACGVLAGKTRESKGVVVKEVVKAYKCRNELQSPTEYRIGAEEQFKIFSEPHPASTLREVVGMDVRNAGEFVALQVARIAPDEVGNMRILKPSFGDSVPGVAQHLRLR